MMAVERVVLLPSQSTFMLIGMVGALIMFIGDMVLYYPSNPKHGTTRSYYDTIDPNGNQLSNSSMQYIGLNRVMLGGVLGPISSVFYSIGFLGLYFAFQPQEGVSSESDGLLIKILPAVTALAFSLMMTIAGVYHALFAYTCFLSREFKKVKEDSSKSSLHRLLNQHIIYMKVIWLCAAAACIIGSVAFCLCCYLLPTARTFHKYAMFFVPIASGIVKIILKAKNWGNLVLSGGITNLWNICFFLVLSQDGREWDGSQRF